MNRAYSTLTIKRSPSDGRELLGLASTPRVDKAGDILEPLGAEFQLPLALLWQHDHQAPIGQVVEAKATAAGIEFRARVAKVDKPGKLKDRIDEAMDSITADLVRGISVGFKPLEWKGLPNGGARFTRWSWHELSVVTLACNVDCTIQAIKAADDIALRDHQQPVRVVKLLRPISTALVDEIDRNAPPTKGLRATDDLLIRSIASVARTADDCLGQLEERVTLLEAGQRKSVIDMAPDEFLAHMAAQRKRLGTGA